MGKVQLVNYVEQHNANPRNEVKATQGVSLLAKINGITLHDVPLYVAGCQLCEDIGNGAADWADITPDGDVIVNDGDGNVLNCVLKYCEDARL